VGSLFAPKVSAPPPPPEPKDVNVDDRIGGTKTTIVTGPDGTKTAIIEENLTPEQKEIRDNLKRLSEDALSKYEALVNDPLLDSMPEIKSAVATIIDGQKASLGDAYKLAARETEKTAAKFGVEDSTTTNILRSQNTKNLAQGLEQLDRDKIGLTNQYRQQEMQNQLGLYGLASGRQDTLLAQGMQTLQLGNQIGLASAQRTDAYNNNLYNNALALSMARANAKAQGWQTFGQLAGFAVGAMGGGGSGFGSTGMSSYYPRTGTTVNWAAPRPAGF
jgi:hypothetical protein